jgi:predicted nuclease of predicted toxin-antitoxin system
MKFKADENLPAEVAIALRNAGHDAFTVHEQGLTGTADADLAVKCRDEERVLVTLDAGFANIRRYPPSRHRGLSVARPRRASAYSVAQLLIMKTT